VTGGSASGLNEADGTHTLVYAIIVALLLAAQEPEAVARDPMRHSSLRHQSRRKITPASAAARDSMSVTIHAIEQVLL